MNPLVQRLGWMLLHSIWEDVVIWIIFQVALIFLRKKSAQSRYLASCTALAAMALLPWMTFSSMDFSARVKTAPVGLISSQVWSSSATAPLAKSSSREPSENFYEPHLEGGVLETFLPWLVGGWAIGVMLLALRMWASLRTIRHLIQLPLPELPPAWKHRLTELCQTAGIHLAVRAGETAEVVVPVVVGWLKPVILLPLGVLAQLPSDQVEAILLHELAHIRRHDYLINLLQSVVETVFFYHPAVRSINGHIREQREMVCDDLSIEWCKNPLAYAEALTTFEEFRRGSLAMSATGNGDLLSRIRRILFGIEPKQQTASLVAVGGLLAVGAYLASMYMVPLLAAKIMTDQERVAQIQALQPPPALDDHVGPGSSVNIRGTINTEDGHPLPRNLLDRGLSLKRSEAMVTSSYLGGSMSGGLDLESSKSQEFYCLASQPGTIQIGIWAENYAPLRETVAPAKNGDEKPLRDQKFNLVLKQGFPGRVQVIGPDGRPLGDVRITAGFPRPGEPLQLSMPPVQTDEKGFATFGNVQSDSEIHLIAFKSGYQMADQVVSQWTNGAPCVWKIEQARSTSGIVIDQETQKPIAGADIVLAARKSPKEANFQVFSPEDGQVLGRTDDKGRFDLENLAANYSSRIYVRSPKYPVAVFPIAYGDRDRICQVPPGLRISGKILDPHGILTSKHPYSPIELQCFYTIQATPNYGIGRNKQQVLSKLGREIPFAFDNLQKGSTSLVLFSSGLIDHRQDFDLEKSGDNYVIDLGSNPSPDSQTNADPRPLRTVEITMNPALVAGSIDGNYKNITKSESWFLPKALPIINGKATGQIPVPTTLELRPDHLIGYWFPFESFVVPPGTGAFDHSLVALPAGVIHGHVTITGALKNRNITVVPLSLKAPLGVKPMDVSGFSNVTLSANNDYVTSPLPCGGTYAMLVIVGSSYIVTPPVGVETEHPLVTQDIEATFGTDTLSGKFVDDSNRPISNQEVFLTYHPTEYSAFSNYAATTGSDGSFTVSNLKLDVPGNYELQIGGDSWLQTKVRIDKTTSLPVTIKLTAKKNPR